MKEVELSALRASSATYPQGNSPKAPEDASRLMLNTDATTAYTLLLKAKLDTLPPDMARTLNKLTAALNHPQLPESDILPIKPSFSELSLALLQREVSLQTILAPQLSAKHQQVPTAAVVRALANLQAALSPLLQESAPCGRELGKLICEGMVCLCDPKNLGAGLIRDLSNHDIALPQAPLNASMQAAVAEVVAASITYLKSNQAEVLAKLPPQDASAIAHQAPPLTSTAPLSAVEQELLATDNTTNPSTEIEEAQMSQRIRDLITKAAATAKKGNLMPDTPLKDDEPVTLTITPQASERSFMPEIKDEPDLPALSVAKHGQLSLSELSARASRLQQQFRQERQRLAAEGKLPNPATLPQSPAQSAEEVLKHTLSPKTAVDHLREAELKLSRRAAIETKVAPAEPEQLTSPKEPALTKASPSLQTIRIQASNALLENAEKLSADALKRIKEQMHTQAQLEEDIATAQANLLKAQQEIVKLQAQIARMQEEALRTAKETAAARLRAQQLQLEAQPAIHARTPALLDTPQPAPSLPSAQVPVATINPPTADGAPQANEAATPAYQDEDLLLKLCAHELQRAEHEVPAPAPAPGQSTTPSNQNTYDDIEAMLLHDTSAQEQTTLNLSATPTQTDDATLPSTDSATLVHPADEQAATDMPASETKIALSDSTPEEGKEQESAQPNADNTSPASAQLSAPADLALQPMPAPETATADDSSQQALATLLNTVPGDEFKEENDVAAQTPTLKQEPLLPETTDLPRKEDVVDAMKLEPATPAKAPVSTSEKPSPRPELGLFKRLFASLFSGKSSQPAAGSSAPEDKPVIKVTRSDSLQHLFYTLDKIATSGSVKEDVIAQVSSLKQALLSPLNDEKALRQWLSFILEPLSSQAPQAQALQQWLLVILCLRLQQMGHDLTPMVQKYQASNPALASSLATMLKLTSSTPAHALESMIAVTCGQIVRLQQLAPSQDHLSALLATYMPLPPLYAGGAEGGFNVKPTHDEAGNAVWQLNFFFDLKDWGPVHIKVHRQVATLHLKVITSNLAALKQVQAHLPALQARLEAHGFDGCDLSVRLGHVFMPTPKLNVEQVAQMADKDLNEA